MSRMSPPAAPAPIAAEAQSKPSSATGTTGPTVTWLPPLSIGGSLRGRAFAAGAATAAVARATAVRRGIRFMTTSFRGGRGVDAADRLEGRETRGLSRVSSPTDRPSEPRIDRLALEREDREHAFVDAGAASRLREA